MLENGRFRLSSRGIGDEKASAEALETVSSPSPPAPNFPSMLWILSASSLMYLWT